MSKRTTTKVATKEVMTPLHPRWEEFVERLMGPEGCNFQTHPQKPMTWRCGGAKDEKRITIAIMEGMGDVDIEESLSFFEHHGGVCDCGVILNTVCAAEGLEADFDYAALYAERVIRLLME
jgi:hypothetical protein